MALLSTKDVAELSGVPLSVARKMIKTSASAGIIKPITSTSRYYIDAEDLNKLERPINEGKIGTRVLGKRTQLASKIRNSLIDTLKTSDKYQALISGKNKWAIEKINRDILPKFGDMKKNKDLNLSRETLHGYTKETERNLEAM